MASELTELAEAAADLAAAADGCQDDVAARAARLADRLAAGQFHVSVLGEFKRGKSTFINAMLGADALPTGVLPLTAVATEVSYGKRGATVVHLDGTTRDIHARELPDYVTEARNPDNEREVARVELRVPADLLASGVVLVDTPGIGSVYVHNDAAARGALLDADGAVLVLSADAPLSEQERELLTALAERQAPTFFVLNKIDHLTAGERDEVRRFVTGVVAGELGRKERLWCVSSRGALDARLRGREPSGAEAGDFGAFMTAFTTFIESDLVVARLGTARRELSRLARTLDDALALERSALALDAKALARKVEEFAAAAQEQRQAVADERTLLARDVAQLNEEIARHLTDFAREAPSPWHDRLRDVAQTTSIRNLEQEMRRTIEQAVHESFESFRQAESEHAEEAWRALAERFRKRTQERVNLVRAAAADLFVVPLPGVVIPEVAEERERFFYLFLHVGTSGEAIGRLMRRLLPASVVRPRLLARARRDLAAEFDKHAGRARWDLTQRLDAVGRRFEVAMAAELDHAVDAILDAAGRAEELRQATEADRRRHQRQGSAARRAAAAVLARVGDG